MGELKTDHNERRTQSVLLRREKERRRRRRRIRIWIRRILFLLVVLAILGAVVFGITRLFGRNKTKAGAYDLPEYITEDYIRINPYSRPKVSLLSVDDIVIHYVGNPGTTAEQNRNYFDNLAKQEDDDSAVYASSNFLVGLDGEILACVPIDEVAYASNTRNNDTLSIEVCHPDETGEFTEETYDALVKLTAYLCHRYSLDSDHVIRHYDVTGKLCPLYYVEHEDAWEEFRADVQKAIFALDADVPAGTESGTGETSSETDSGSDSESAAEA